MTAPKSHDPRPDHSQSRARKKFNALWQDGNLFHSTTRYPRRPDSPRHDRLAGILKCGLVAPAQCQDGSVLSDLHIVFTDSPVPYDSLVFLHRFGPQSHIYTFCEPGRFFVFVDPAIGVLTPEALGPDWVVLCQDEVYVRDRVELEHVTSVVVHPADADAVMSRFLADFQRLEIPLYDYDGVVLWPAERGASRDQRPRDK